MLQAMGNFLIRYLHGQKKSKNGSTCLKFLCFLSQKKLDFDTILQS